MILDGKIVSSSKKKGYAEGGVVSGPTDMEKFAKQMQKEEDQINPSHYQGDLVMRICEHFKLGSHLMNAAKYLLRAGEKLQGDETKEEAEIRDLKKAQWYINRRIMKLRGDKRIGNLDIEGVKE